MKKETKSKPPTSIIPAAEASEIRQATNTIVAESVALTITTSRDEDESYEVLRRIAERKKFIEGKRLAITKPLNASLKAANSMFKELALPLVRADEVIRGKITAFHRKREAQAVAKQARLMAKAEEAEASGDDEKAFAIEEKAAAVTANVGKSSMVKRWVFEVEDASKVPLEYMEVNETAIRKAIALGVRDIPGVQIHQQESVRVI